MKRAIKYRGMDKLGNWQYGSLVVHPNGKTFIISYRGNDPLWVEVKPATVGQFTGLNDVHGDEIYEGDKVATSKYVGEVRWMRGKCCFQLSPGGVYLPPHCEIAGNIHESFIALYEELADELGIKPGMDAEKESRPAHNVRIRLDEAAETPSASNAGTTRPAQAAAWPTVQASARTGNN